MATRTSGLRVAHSVLTPAGGAVVSTELDFQLGSRQGIEIHGVLGGMLISDDDAAGGATVTEVNADQTLHLETGTLETVPNTAASDTANTDSEIFYRQSYHGTQIVSTVGALSGFLSPNGLVMFPETIKASRNITHRTEVVESGTLFEMWLLIYYNYVEFSLAELGVLLARRQ